MKQFGLSLFPVGISAGLMIMLLLLMIMPSTTDGFEITVKADRMIKPLRWTITVEVNGTETVEDLKKTIMAKLKKKTKTKIESDPKRLTLQYGENDEILRDGQTIGYYRIKNGDIVRLSIGEFRVFVQYKIGNEVKIYPIWVKSEETVAILKKRIKNESGIKPEEQILKCDNNTNGSVLEDKKALKDYGIREDTRPTIILSTKFEITVTADEQIFKKNAITVEVIGLDKVEDLKKKIMKALDANTKTKIGSDHKRLILQLGQNDNYDILNDEKRIDYYGIKKGNSIRICIGEFEIVVQYKIENELKKTYTIWMKKEETVAILKKKIQNESKIRPDAQILKCNINGDGGTVTVLEDEKTMTNYGIGEGTTVLLVTEYEIVVKYKKDNEEKTVTVWLKGTDSALILMEKIVEKIKNDLPGIKSVIINDRPSSDYNEVLNDYEKYRKRLKEYGVVGEGTTIYVVRWYKF